MMTTEKPLMLTTAEAAAVLGTTEERLRLQRAIGEGPKYVAITPRSVLYFRVEVEEFRGHHSGRQ